MYSNHAVAAMSGQLGKSSSFTFRDHKAKQTEQINLEEAEEKPLFRPLSEVTDRAAANEHALLERDCYYDYKEKELLAREAKRKLSKAQLRQMEMKTKAVFMELDKAIYQNAKRYCKQKNISIKSIVENALSQLPHIPEK